MPSNPEGGFWTRECWWGRGGWGWQRPTGGLGVLRSGGRGGAVSKQGEGEGDLMGGMGEVMMAGRCVSDQKLGTEIDSHGARGLLGPKHIKEMGSTCQGSQGGLCLKASLVMMTVDGGLDYLVNLIGKDTKQKRLQ